VELLEEEVQLRLQEEVVQRLLEEVEQQHLLGEVVQQLQQVEEEQQHLLEEVVQLLLDVEEQQLLLVVVEQLQPDVAEQPQQAEVVLLPRLAVAKHLLVRNLPKDKLNLQVQHQHRDNQQAVAKLPLDGGEELHNKVLDEDEVNLLKVKSLLPLQTQWPRYSEELPLLVDSSRASSK